MPCDPTEDKSTLVQVMVWCRQATSHYLSQCWPRSMSPYGVARPQWVSTLITSTLRYGPNQTDATSRALHQETVRLRLSLAWVNTAPITSSETLSIKRAHWRSQDLMNPQSHEVHVWNFPSDLKFIKGLSITPLESTVILECDFELL